MIPGVKSHAVIDHSYIYMTLKKTHDCCYSFGSTEQFNWIVAFVPAELHRSDIYRNHDASATVGGACWLVAVPLPSQVLAQSSGAAQNTSSRPGPTGLLTCRRLILTTLSGCLSDFQSLNFSQPNMFTR